MAFYRASSFWRCERERGDRFAVLRDDQRLTRSKFHDYPGAGVFEPVRILTVVMKSTTSSWTSDNYIGPGMAREVGEQKENSELFGLRVSFFDLSRRLISSCPSWVSSFLSSGNCCPWPCENSFSQEPENLSPRGDRFIIGNRAEQILAKAEMNVA